MKKRPQRTRSLIARIVGYYWLLALVPAVLVPVVSFFLARQALQNSVFDRLEVAVTLKENELNRWVEDNKDDILFIASSPEFSSHAWRLLTADEGSPEYRVSYSALSNYLNALLTRKDSFREIMILAERGGRIVLSTDKTHEGDYRVTDTYFTEGRRGTFVQNVYTSPLTGKPAMTISTPILDPTNGNTVGVLVVHLNLERLDNIILERTGLGETGETYLVSKYSTLLSEARFSSAEFARGVQSEAVRLGVQGVDGLGAYANPLGIPVLGVYRWVDEREVLLIAEISQQEAFAPAVSLAGTLFALGLVSALFLGGGGYLVALQIARPILAITRTAQRVALGDLSQQAPVLTRDEIGVLATTFNQMTLQLQDLVTGLEQRVSERTRELARRALQLQAAAEVGSAVASIRDLDRLLQQVAQLIAERFGYYHVGIFLLDERRENAVLRASNSPGGQRMLARGHKLAVGQKGIVGYVAEKREPRIAMDVGQDAVYFDNPDLPETRSEMALPLMAGGELLGVLDVQSTEEAAFAQDDIATLQVLADQVAVAIENAKLFAETQSALDAARRAYGEVSRQAWLKILRSRPDIGYLCDSRGRVEPAKDGLSEQMAQARKAGRVVQLDLHSILIPFKVQDQPIGVLRMEKPVEAGEWSKKEIDLAEALVENLSEALEAARLYSDSQRRAERERILAEITAKVRASTDINAIMQTAVQQLSDALQISRSVIRLRPAQIVDDNRGDSDE